MAWIWSMWDESVTLERLIESGEMFCWAAKWYGEPEIEFRSVHHDGKKRMIRRIWKLLDKADAAVHFNGRRFDVPYIQRAFLEQGMTPPSPYKQIDLLETVKRQFKFPSNKLEYVASHLLGERKHPHEGFQLWVSCMKGDPAAWERMKTYNIHDVELTERLYAKLLPWIRSHPNRAAYDGEDECARCGSKHFERRGREVCSTNVYQRLHCLECGYWFRSKTRLDTTGVVQIAA